MTELTDRAARKAASSMLTPGGVRPPWLRAMETTPEESRQLSPDGLPAAPFTTLVEAVSWLALGRSIPHQTWHLQALLPSALEDHLKARAKEELATIKGKEESNYGRTRSELAKAIAADVQIRAAYASIGTGSEGEDAILERAQRSLFDKLATGVLTCEGRDGPRAPLWVPLPPSYFSHPVMLRLNHNILELRDDTPMDAVDLVRGQISRWIDLRVSTDDLRAAFCEAATLGAVIPLSAPTTHRGGAPQMDDSRILEELRRESTIDGFTLRDAILKRADSIEGKNVEAKVRRLTRKYSKRFGAI